jgi:hypothetical protein
MQSTDCRLHVRGEPHKVNAIILPDVQSTISVAETHRSYHTFGVLTTLQYIN